eukprot:scaffold1629_cov369-Prasinococcus_capsulatus_cf.AAC.13
MASTSCTVMGARLAPRQSCAATSLVCHPSAGELKRTRSSQPYSEKRASKGPPCSSEMPQLSNRERGIATFPVAKNAAL